MLSARTQRATPGVNGGKGGPTRSGGAFISTLAPEGGEAPFTMSRAATPSRTPMRASVSGAQHDAIRTVAGVRIIAGNSGG